MLIGLFTSGGTKYSTDLLLAEVIPFTTDYVSDISPIATWSTSKVERFEPWKTWQRCKFYAGQQDAPSVKDICNHVIAHEPHCLKKNKNKTRITIIIIIIIIICHQHFISTTSLG